MHSKNIAFCQGFLAVQMALIGYFFSETEVVLGSSRRTADF